MRRRAVLLLLAGAMTAGRPLHAQQKAMPVIGWLGLGSPQAGGTRYVLAAFRQGLGEAGFVEGQNVAIEHRWAEGQYDRLPALAAELVGRRVDVIVSNGGEPVAAAAKTATSTIPIVSGFGGDPVEAGLPASLARPGGNLTGFTLLTADLTAKRLELPYRCWSRASGRSRYWSTPAIRRASGSFGMRRKQRAKKGSCSRSFGPAPKPKSMALLVNSASTR